MKQRKNLMARLLVSLACLLVLYSAPVRSQALQGNSPEAGMELRYVVYLSRHGVRSPTGKAAQYNAYSKGEWPTWPVQPGYLTPHGFHLMEIFGAFDRLELAKERLIQATGCEDASKLTIYADSNQRTRETGFALAHGLMPGCNVPVQSLPEGTNDPLFHPVPALAHLNPTHAKAAVAGRIGENAENLTAAYRLQISALDEILARCGTAPTSTAKRVSLFDFPTTLSEGNGDHLVDLKGPINTASTLSENLLLEYTEGLEDSSVGWGCVHHAELLSLMSLHTAASDFAQRTSEIAKAQASNLLEHIRLSIQQAVEQKTVPGALGKPSDLALFLIGHDTNLENVAGLLDINWIADGRRDDTPPGAALIFEVWRSRSTGESSVRLYFTEQTLEQMRASTSLTASNPAERVRIFIPGCSQEDLSCTLPTFSHLVESTIDKRDVIEKSMPTTQ
jgi:4-phytase / acid phosphatase